MSTAKCCQTNIERKNYNDVTVLIQSSYCSLVNEEFSHTFLLLAA